ncbi:TIGR02449 family protein, partial [Pseudomonas sp. MWU12-2312b]
MVVNDDAGNRTPRGDLRFIVGTPPGAGSLLQG